MTESPFFKINTTLLIYYNTFLIKQVTLRLHPILYAETVSI